ncbi:transmembrane reductase CYB561D2-like isoform X1 [Dermacentor variabilis]|uniref:transmembrane reductase CYB561D2-like isoform X1 n=1 Tax=Dermacentor variabilis TaxID=34621 RepID=UPI003F5B2E72
MAVMANRASGSRSATAGALATTLLFSVLVLYAVKPDTWRFLFPWHPTLAVLAFHVRGGERHQEVLQGTGRLARSKYGLITQPAVLLVRLGRTRLHWALQAASTACAVLGCWAAFVHKAALGKPHFATWHSWAGLGALLLTLLEAAVGVGAMTLRTSMVGKQQPWLKYTALRRVHRALGLSAHGFATAAMVLGLRSHYGRETLAKALPLGDALAVQLAVQALAAAPFTAVGHQLWRRYGADKSRK